MNRFSLVVLSLLATGAADASSPKALSLPRSGAKPPSLTKNSQTLFPSLGKLRSAEVQPSHLSATTYCLISTEHWGVFCFQGPNNG